MSASKLEAMEKDFRELIVSQMAALAEGQKALNAGQVSLATEVKNLQIAIATAGDIKELRHKVEILEAERNKEIGASKDDGDMKRQLKDLVAFKNRIYGVIIACNTIGACVGCVAGIFFAHYWK